MIMILWAL